LLSHVAAATLAAFGELLATDLLGSAVAALRAYASALVTLGLLLALVGVGIANYADTDQSSNHLRTWKTTAPMSSSSSCRL
jgi:hypothetical protein